MSRITGMTAKAEMPWHWWALRYATAGAGLFMAMGFGVIGHDAERTGWTASARVGVGAIGALAVWLAVLAIHFPLRPRRVKGMTVHWRALHKWPGNVVLGLVPVGLSVKTRKQAERLAAGCRIRHDHVLERSTDRKSVV